jgi:hypothetical protein
MSWLAAGVPLALVCDLVSTGDPRSVEVCALERPADDPVHLDTARPASARSALA